MPALPDSPTAFTQDLVHALRHHSLDASKLPWPLMEPKVLPLNLALTRVPFFSCSEVKATVSVQRTLPKDFKIQSKNGQRAADECGIKDCLVHHQKRGGSPGILDHGGYYAVEKQNGTSHYDFAVFDQHHVPVALDFAVGIQWQRLSRHDHLDLYIGYRRCTTNTIQQ
jgi:hypothetical protein